MRLFKIRGAAAIFFFFIIAGCDDDGENDADGGADSGADASAAESIGYADEVVDAPCAEPKAEYGDPQLAVNGVRGGGENSGGLDVFSLRYCDDKADKYLTLRWSSRKVQNGAGADFAVFENSKLINGGPNVFMEQLIVYLSRDGSEWVAFPHDYVNNPETEYSQDPAAWQGFAGVQPVKLHEEDNPVDPFDPELAGGDHFDLDYLPDEGEAAAIKAEGFTYLKIVQATSKINPDTGAEYLKDPSSFDEAADIDGVYARYLSEI